MSSTNKAEKEKSPAPPPDRNEDPAFLNSSKNFQPTKTEDYGAFFYSERFGNEPKRNWYDKFISYGASREVLQKNVCEQNVQTCIEKRKSTLSSQPNLKPHRNLKYMRL